MLNPKFIAATAASLVAAIVIFGLFLFEAFKISRLSVSSTGKDEWLFLVICFFSSLLLVFGVLHRARLKFRANKTEIHQVTYFFMATALASVIWSICFFSWCARYHSEEFLFRGTVGNLEIAFIGSLIGPLLLGFLALFLSDQLFRSQQ